MLRVHSIVSVDSEGRNEGLSRTPENFVFQLSEKIHFYKKGRNYEYFCKLKNIKIPVTYYNIDSNYKVLKLY